MGRKKDANTVNILERRLKVLDLRRDGYSFRAIGKELEISEAQAHRDFKSAIQNSIDIEQHEANELRQLQIDRLEKMLKDLKPELEAKQIGAIKEATKIIQELSKLQGLYMPAKIEHSGTLSWELIMRANQDESATPDDTNPFA